MNTSLRLRTFPGVLYDGDGTLLAGEGPDFDSQLVDALPHKALIRDKPGDVEVAVLEEGDQLWVLPDSFGSPPVLPMVLLTDLADLVRAGRKVGFAARKHVPYKQIRDALMLLLDDSGGKA